MRAAWFLRSRQMRWAMSWWLAITGYNTDDASITNRIYLFYLVIFFAIWGLVVLAFFTSAVAQFITALGAQPAWATARAGVLALLAWWLWGLYRASRACPIQFSADDALLACTTPMSRRAVAFTWLPGAWFKTGIFFWSLAITLGFALAEIGVGGKPTWADAPAYLARGFRFLLPVAFLHLGMIALTWAFGCLRLQSNRVRAGMTYYPLMLGVALGIGFAASGPGGNPLQLLALPALQPLLSASGAAGYLPGVVVGLLWSGLGALALYAASPGLNLSRAAQETQSASAASAAVMLGNQQLAEAIRLKERLPGGSAPMRLPERPGGAALAWKAAIRSLRGLSLGGVGGWALLLIISGAYTFMPDWPSRAAVLFFWVLQLHERASAELRADLGMWFLFQTLPVERRRRILAEVLPAALLAAGLGWLGLAIGAAAGGAVPAAQFLLLPFVALNLGLSAAFDVLRQTRSRHLLIGSTPAPGLVGLLLSAAVLGMNLYVLNLFEGRGGVFVAVLLNLLVGYMILQWCGNRFKQLGK